MKGPFQVVEDEPGCAHCGQGKTWTVVDAEDTAIGQSWGQDSEGECPADAHEMANLLNAVHEAASCPQVGRDIVRDLRDSLENLVRLKDIKERMEAGTASNLERECYAMQKEPAWTIARETLAELRTVAGKKS